ncbi:MAG: hypothetical protein V7640_3574, partial [Betaproteobacteria bacterium]
MALIGWAAACAAGAMSALSFACSAAYPDKPVRWVLGFAPGGAPDA